jgi:RpiB/LacA/LacB family sugar-phosphate isomerase
MSENLKQVLVIGADHGGFAEKELLREWLVDQGYQVVDCGALNLDPADDYPQIAAAVAKELILQQQAGVQSTGILICRSGAGMVMAANRFSAVRAAGISTPQQAAHARAHNDANVIALSGEWMDIPLMKECISEFLQTPFSAEERHQRRVKQLASLGT